MANVYTSVTGIATTSWVNLNVSKSAYNGISPRLVTEDEYHLLMKMKEEALLREHNEVLRSLYEQYEMMLILIKNS